jgi:hypothetical protein
MEGIKDTIFKFLRLDNLVDNLSGYLETRLELFKVEVREDVARGIGTGTDDNSHSVAFNFVLAILQCRTGPLP